MFRSTLQSLITKIVVVEIPLFVKRLIVLDLGQLMVMFELLSHIIISNCSHLLWQYLAMKFEYLIVKPHSIRQHFLQLLAHSMLIYIRNPTLYGPLKLSSISLTKHIIGDM